MIVWSKIQVVFSTDTTRLTDLGYDHLTRLFSMKLVKNQFWTQQKVSNRHKKVTTLKMQSIYRIYMKNLKYWYTVMTFLTKFP